MNTLWSLRLAPVRHSCFSPFLHARSKYNFFLVPPVCVYVGYMGVMGMYRPTRLDQICLHIHIFPFAKMFVLNQLVWQCFQKRSFFVLMYILMLQSLNKTIETGEKCVSGLISLLLMKQIFLFVKLLDLLVNQVSVPLCRETLSMCHM